MTKYFSINPVGIILCILFLTTICGFQNASAESLYAAYSFGTDRNSTTSWENVISPFVGPFSSLSGTTSALVIASFTTEATESFSTSRDATFRLIDNTGTPYTSGSITRTLISNQGDKGIGSAVYIFGTVTPTTTFTLQHMSSAASREIKTSANLVAIPLQTSSSNITLTNGVSLQSGNLSTAATTFSTVVSTTLTTPAGYSTGDFYAAASVQTSQSVGASTQVGEWNIQYSTDGTNWFDMGLPVQRSITGTSDNGIANLVAVLPQQNVSGATYQFRVAHRAISGTITTSNTTLAAVFTGYTTGGTDYYFPISETSAATTSIDGSTLTEAIGDNFLPRVNTDIFLHAQYWMESTGQNTGIYDLYTDYGFGTVVFDGGDQERYLASANDTGSGASVGLATGLTTGTTYRASLRHAHVAGGQTLTTNNPFLIIWDLNTFSLSAICPTAPPQTPTATPGPDNALFYDGTDNYVNVADNNRLDLTNQLSMECWVKPDSVIGTQTLIGKYGFGTPGVTLNLNGTSAQVTYSSNFGTTVTLTDNTAPVFNFSTCDWYHVATTFDNGGSGTGTLTLYVNGVAAETNGTAPAPATNTGALTIGQSGNSAARQWFSGVIDEARIWQDYAFGTTALRDWMCKKVTSDHPAWSNLSAYYRFDENGLGATVYDYGSYGIHGTATNFAFGTERICSSAPVGDESDHDYNGNSATPGDFSATLTYAPEGDFMTATGTGGNWADAGIQLYMVDQGPNSNVPPFAWGTGYVLDPLRYWGVFVANGSSPVYQITYDWTLHQGLTKESWNSLKLADRDGNCDLPWQDRVTETLNTVAPRTLIESNWTGTEFILGGKINSAAPLAITLARFFAEIDESGECIRVSWKTATEVDTIGYYLWRSDSESNEYTLLTDSFMPSEAVSETTGASYEYIDCTADLSRDVYYYFKLEEVDFDSEKPNPIYGPAGPVSRTASAVKLSESFNSKNDSKCFINTLLQ